MFKTIIATMILIIVAVILSFVLNGKEVANQVMIMNNLESKLTLHVACYPSSVECMTNLNWEKSASYHNVEKIEIHVGSWFQFEQYDLGVPLTGKFELKMQDIKVGRVPKGFRLLCYKGGSKQKTALVDCKTDKPIPKTI